MRTTAGKTNTHRRPKRRILIFQEGRVVNERRASSLAQALREFAKERFGKGHSIIVGNTLTVGDRVYTAQEER